MNSIALLKMTKTLNMREHRNRILLKIGTEFSPGKDLIQRNKKNTENERT